MSSTCRHKRTNSCMRRNKFSRQLPPNSPSNFTRKQTATLTHNLPTLAACHCVISILNAQTRTKYFVKVHCLHREPEEKVPSNVSCISLSLALSLSLYLHQPCSCLPRGGWSENKLTATNGASNSCYLFIKLHTLSTEVDEREGVQSHTKQRSNSE